MPIDVFEELRTSISRRSSACKHHPPFDRKAETVQIPPGPKEEPADPNGKAAHLEIVPCDVALAPGGSTSFKLRTYDAKGRFLKEVNGELSLLDCQGWTRDPAADVQDDLGLRLFVRHLPPPVCLRIRRDDDATRRAW